VRILIPTADYPPIEGGISTVALSLSRELARQGHEVTVIAPHFDGQEAFDAAEPVAVVRYRGYGLGWLRLGPMLRATWPYLRVTDLALGINIAYGGLIGWVGKTCFSKPYVTFAYAYEFLKFPKASPLGWFLRRLYAGAERVVAISEFTRDRLAEFGVQPSSIAVVLPGTDGAKDISAEAARRARERFALECGPVILGVGRFVRRKGHLTLVQAMPRILERVPGAQLVLVGRGPRMNAVIQEAYRLGVREQVVLPGRISDEELAGLYQACTVFALPTGQDRRGQVEGFGLVFTEAHGYGKPVVAGRSGGAAEAVLDGETGLIVEPNQPDALAEAILRILEDPALAERLGANGRQRVETTLNWRVFATGVLEAVSRRP